MSLVYNESVDASPTYCQSGITAAVASYKAPYGRPGCDSPNLLVDNFLDSLATTDSEPNANSDFILVTGDFAGHGEHYLVFGAMTKVASKLKAEFPTKYVFPALGNNDLPEDYYASKQARDRWYKDVLAIWSPLILCKTCSWRSYTAPTTERRLRNTFLTGGYYKVSLSDKMAMLLLNTNYYMYTVKAVPVTDRFLGEGEKQLKWLKNELAKAERSGKKVIIVGHISPG